MSTSPPHPPTPPSRPTPPPPLAQPHTRDTQDFLEHDPDLANAVDVSEFGTGYRPLHYAAYGGFLEVCQALREAGARPLVAGENGVTALFLAAQAGKPDVVRFLLDLVRTRVYITCLFLCCNGVSASVLNGVCACHRQAFRLFSKKDACVQDMQDFLFIVESSSGCLSWFFLLYGFPSKRGTGEGGGGIQYIYNYINNCIIRLPFLA